MPRIPELTQRDQIPVGKQHLYDTIQASRGGIRGPFGILLHSPEVAGRAAHLGAYLRYESTLSDADRELTIITTAAFWGCKVEWAAHAKLARQAGVSEQTMETVRTQYSIERLPEAEQLLVGYTRELLEKHEVSEATFKAALSKYGQQGVVELTATVGYYSMLATTLNAFQVEPQSGL